MHIQIEAELKKTWIIPNEQKLLSMLFQETTSYEEIENLVKHLNIDKANHNYLLLLTHLGYKVNWISFPSEIIPQLKGVHRYYQTQNALILQKLHLYIRKLNAYNIQPLVLKGGAMRLHYAPGMTRMMADIDIAIEKNLYNEAVTVIKDLGAELSSEVEHAQTFKIGSIEFDIHRYVFKNYLEKDTSLWEHTQSIHINGSHMKVLSPLDTFIHLLDTQSRCVFIGEMSDRRMKWLYDTRMLLEHWLEPNWEAIAKRAAELNCRNSVHLMMKLFSECFPALISEEDVNHYFMVDKNYQEWLNDAIEYRDMIESYYQERGDLSNTAITLWLIKLRMKHQPLWKEYKYNRHDYKKMKRGKSYISFVLKHYHFNQPLLLIQRYVSRIRFRLK